MTAHEKPRPFSRARIVWQDLSASLWFVPAIMLLGAVALAVAMVELSSLVDREALVRYPRLFGAGAQSSRDMLSTIAGAMMTVAGVTFSITMLAVSQSSTQYTPRILRNFMRDRANQVTLGTLTGAFVYCLVVIRTIRGDEELRFIPALAVLMAFVLAIAAIAVLIYFVHHVAASLDAWTILAQVRADTVAAIERLFPDEVGEEAAAVRRDLPPDDAWHPVPARASGYVTHVDADGLLALACERDTVLRMERAIGDHVVRGTPIVSLAGPPGTRDREHLADAVGGLFGVAAYRTVEQDAAFGFRQMVDVALKALSPGVNDTTTAVACIDAIGTALVALASRGVPDRYRERDGQLRMIAEGPDFPALTAIAVDEIRRAAAGNPRVLAHQLGMLQLVASVTATPSRRRVLLAQADHVLRTATRSIDDPDDLALVQRAHAAVHATGPRRNEGAGAR